MKVGSSETIAGRSIAGCIMSEWEVLWLDGNVIFNKFVVCNCCPWMNGPESNGARSWFALILFFERTLLLSMKRMNNLWASGTSEVIDSCPVQSEGRMTVWCHGARRRQSSLLFAAVSQQREEILPVGLRWCSFLNCKICVRLTYSTHMLT